MDLDDTGGVMGPETVYGTHEDSHVVMSEKVQSLAGSIYQEFERMIARYDEDVVKTLMPLLVNVLECLDAAYQANQEHDVELELLREDNEQLVTQYEREKGGRKAAEQKLLEAEDAAECERKELAARLEALESIVRMLELKHKNSMEHASRLEERESELKREYAKLHDRYTELFKTHMDYMERTKLLLSAGQLAGDSRADLGRVHANRLNIGRSSGPVSYGFASLEGATDGVDSITTSPISSEHSSPSLHSELDGMNMSGGVSHSGTTPGGGASAGGVKMVEKSQETDAVSLEHKGMVTSPSTPSAAPPPPVSTGRSHTKNEKRSANTLYQELSFQDSEALADVDEGADITGSWVHPGEYASSGMGKEVENLIMENNELLATKNALNIVKDDLIVKVDELTGEQEMLREEIGALKIQRERNRTKIADLEDEVKKLKESLETKPDQQEDEADVPMAQRKRFTRVEMARVLMERNQYKERFMELQEAVRWTEMIRASKNNPALDKKSKQSVWKFFSNLFGSNERPNRPILAPHLSYHAPTHHVVPGVRALPRPGQEYLDTELGSGSEKLVARRAVERQEQYRQVQAHVRKEDGRLQAYGWSLPGKVGSGTPSKGLSSHGAVPVPVPVYCRPLAETQPGMKIWCGAGVNLMGGHTRDGGLMVGGSVFYYDEPTTVTTIGGGTTSTALTEVESLDKELNAGREAAILETQLSSLVWICTSTHAASTVAVIDANNPADILKTFPVCANHLLCIASVPGASAVDYMDTVTTVNDVDEPVNPDADPESLVGRVSFIETDLPATTAEESTEQQSMEKQQVESQVVPSAHTANNKEESSNTANGSDSEAVENGEEVEINGNPLDTSENPQEPGTENSEKGQESSAGESRAQTEQEQQEDEGRWARKEKMSSVLATMWLGAQSGTLYVHSSVANWDQCLHSVKLKDAVLAVVHVNGRVVAALANGTVAIFRRDADGAWDLTRYHLVTLGLPQHSVRCLSVVGENVWCGYRNKVHVLDPRDLKVVHSLETHPRKESQVRQLAWLGEGVWVSIRLDSTIRLYHAHTYQHLQDVDIEPYVSKMLGTGKVGFSFVRITALLISSSRLWIGTANGVIISVPLSECGGGAAATAAIVPRGTLVPGGSVRVAPAPGSFVPYCTMAHAQLSFHGHRDAVKFFVAVPGTGGMSAASTPTAAEANQTAVAVVGQTPPHKRPPAMLVLSGGEGYIDFRIGDGDMEESVIEEDGGVLDAPQNSEIKGEKSHLIVWQVALV